MKESLYRAMRTFLQTAFGYIATNLALYLTESGGMQDTSALRTGLVGLCVSALASGLAAVMNREKRNHGEDDDGIEEDEK